MNPGTLASIVVLLFALNVSGQENQCSLRISDLPDAPELLGFRIGMTTEQVKARVPQVVFGKADRFAVSRTSINPDFDPRIDKASFAGVRTVSLDFLDGRLTSLWLGYDGSFKWQTVDDFVKGISQSLHLPNAWSSWRSRGQRLRCADFQMTVTIVAEGPGFRILDDHAAQTLTARREAKEEQASDVAEASVEKIFADKQARIYYSENCRLAKEIETKNRLVFKTAEEAETAGYKLAKQCE